MIFSELICSQAFHRAAMRIIVITGACLLCGTASQAEELGDVLKGLHSEWSELEGNGEGKSAHRQLWIERLESATATSDGPKLQASAMAMMAELLKRNGELREAEAVFERLATSADASASMRLAAYMSAYQLASTSAGEDRAMSYLDQFDQLYDSTSGDEDLEIAKSFGSNRLLSNWNRASLIRRKSARLASSLRDEGKDDEACAIEITGYEKSLSYMDAHIAAMSSGSVPQDVMEELVHMNWGEERALMSYASLAVNAGNALVGRQQADRGRTFFVRAENKLKQMIETYPSGKGSQHGGALFLQAVARTSDTPADEVAAAKWWVDRCRPGHEIVSALRERAVVLQASQNAEEIEASYAMFGLVMELEKKWYKDDYLTHTNYQWAVVGAAQDLLRLGAVARSVALLNELKGVELRGSFIRMSLESLTRAINNHYVPVDDVIEERITSLGNGLTKHRENTATETQTGKIRGVGATGAPPESCAADRPGVEVGVWMGVVTVGILCGAILMVKRRKTSKVAK